MGRKCQPTPVFLPGKSPGSLQSMGSQRVRHNWATSPYFFLSNAYIRNLEKWYWRIDLQGSNGERDMENSRMDMGRGEEDEMYGESNLETYIIIYKKRMNGNFLYVSEKINQVLCINLERWDGKGGRREVQKWRDIYLWLIHIEVWHKTKFCKAIILQYKKVIN